MKLDFKSLKKLLWVKPDRYWKIFLLHGCENSRLFTRFSYETGAHIKLS